MKKTASLVVALLLSTITNTEAISLREQIKQLTAEKWNEWPLELKFHDGKCTQTYVSPQVPGRQPEPDCPKQSDSIIAPISNVGVEESKAPKEDVKAAKGAKKVTKDVKDADSKSEEAQDTKTVEKEAGPKESKKAKTEEKAQNTKEVKAEDANDSKKEVKQVDAKPEVVKEEKKEEAKEETPADDSNLQLLKAPQSAAQVHDYDVQPPQASPAVQPSPVKTTIKGAGCNAAACPSTGPSCCMVSPDKNMTPESLGRQEKKASLAQSHDYDVFPNSTPKVEASPVKNSIKGAGCNSAPCPSTSTPCCKVTTLSQKEDEAKAVEQKAEEPKAVEKKAEEPKAVEMKAEDPKAVEMKAEDPKAVDKGVIKPDPNAQKIARPSVIAKPTPFCCQPDEHGTVQHCMKEVAAGQIYCPSTDIINGTSKEDARTGEKKERDEEKEAAKKAAKAAGDEKEVSTDVEKAQSLAQGDDGNPKKLKHKGCNMQRCPHPSGLCCETE